MKWEKIEYPWTGIKIPDSEIESRMKLFDDFIKYFGFDCMARAESVGSYERLLYGRRSYNNVANSCYYPHGWKEPEDVPEHDHGLLFKKNKIGGLEMSREERKNGTQIGKRLNYAQYGIGQQRLEELQNGCRAGIYSTEILAAACKGIEAISPWILLSVRHGKSFDVLAVEWELGKMERPPYCRTDFYSCRRRFFANLDRVLKERGTEHEAI